ncbi:DUF418 domain-containing protein [Actinoplanes sp. Pm04-4]|uniref:DUF418 domain-containing protein n=1 Tax=Paractinoplanes pyxinae TaxID=2997416 RepID=A0ABT4B007_9ACTN|nr:DUF418 domain-containing protein [Actinoplanes pyxinae]MCY1139784.1 DUF418 domain-containing protein [Actinoplanes pyxinae]
MTVKRGTAMAGPVGARERDLAPDLARGLMLALIALANSVVYLYARPYGVRQHIVEPGLVDRIVSVVTVTAVDGRAYPMFAALFAYGVVQILQRQRAAGASLADAKRLLRRRSWWLVAFGFAHALLLFPGDILGLYGVAGFVLVALTQVSDRKLLIAAGCWLVVVALVQGAAYMAPPSGQRSFFWSFETADPLRAMALRPLEWLMTPAGVLGVGSAILVGTWAARRRILADPASYRALLTRTAIVGLTTAILGGLPAGLAVGHFWTPSTTFALWGISALHAVTGVVGGLGYAALIGLVAIRARGRVVNALAATGQRSLSCYLFQSVVFVALLAPWTLGLGATISTSAVALLALGTWLVSVVLSDLLRRAGRRGPAEIGLRKLSYRTGKMTV